MVSYSISICVILISVVCSSNYDHRNNGETIADGWTFVRDLFKENFAHQRDLGASLAIYHQGTLVVDIWGGWFDRSFTKAYDHNTLQLVFSTTKGVTAIAAALCVQRGLLNYSELVTKYWPEYGQHGKENTTVADILSHRAGLPNQSGPTEQIVNWTAMVHSLEQQHPLWPPGTTHSYHALTYGWLAGELIRRVDSKKRTVGQFIRDEITDPLKLEFYIGLPSEHESRVSPLTFSSETSQAFNESVLSLYVMFNDRRIHQAEIPAANGITNARSLARLYASLITDLDDGSQKRLLNEAVLKQAIKSNTPDGELEFLSHVPSSFSMGFILLDEEFPFFRSEIFGHPGAGGSIGFAIPSKNLSFAFVMNQLDMGITGEPYVRIRTILEKIADKISSQEKPHY